HTLLGHQLRSPDVVPAEDRDSPCRGQSRSRTSDEWSKQWAPAVGGSRRPAHHKVSVTYYRGLANSGRRNSIRAETTAMGDATVGHGQHHDLGTDFDAIVEVGDVVVGQPDAA